MKDEFQIKGLRALAAALGVSLSTSQSYVSDQGWQFGSGPWSIATVASMRSWIASNRQSRTGGEPVDNDADDERAGVGFYINLARTPAALKELADLAAVKPEYQNLAEPILSGIEREVLEGSTELNPDEVQAVLREFLLVRLMWLRQWNMVAGHLAERSGATIRRRMIAVASQMTLDTRTEFQRIENARAAAPAPAPAQRQKQNPQQSRPTRQKASK